MEFDLVVAGGTLVTDTAQFRADIGIADGRIAAVGTALRGTRTLDATGLLVMPGGVDSHCHIEQLQEGGGADEESWTTGSQAALAGGTTTVVSFSTQFKGQPIGPALAEYRRRAAAGAMVDHAFHQIVTDPTEAVLAELPGIVQSGIRSFKVFLTYDPLRLDDRQYIRVLAAARRLGCLVTVHAENYDAIALLTEALLAAGLSAPKYHAWSRPPVVEREATARAVALAELIDCPIEVFHVSCPEAAEEIARARARGVAVHAETCPQYLALGADSMDRPGFEGAKFMCSPALRDPAATAGLWDAIRAGTIGVISSDHSGWSFEGTRGKRVNGADAPFRDIPNGMPGLAARLPLLWHLGVNAGHIMPSDFVRLACTAPARLFGLQAKGTLTPGSDADILLWDPNRRVTVTNALMQHAIDYTPYEGMEVTGWPRAVLLRGTLAMQDDAVLARPGSGRYLPVGPYDAIRPTGRLPNGFDASAHL